MSSCHLLRIAAEAIPDARLSHDVAWLSRVIFDLAPQLIHKHPPLGQILRLACSPHFLQQRRVRQQFAGMRRERLEDLIRGRSQ